MRFLSGLVAVLLVVSGLNLSTVQADAAAPPELVAAVKSHKTLYVVFDDDTSAALRPCATRASRVCYWDGRRGGSSFIHLNGITYKGFTIERTGS